METLGIDLGTRSYSIYVGQGLLQTLSSYLASRDTWVLITDDIVDRLYGERLIGEWKDSTMYRIVLPAGEDTKTLTRVEETIESMLNLGVTRSSGIIALGGGVVGDVAGFCASIYMRGIAYAQVPTTLLAQVDSSVGGKTAVNMPQGKNAVGSFYQPEVVVIDTTTLRTLPHRQLISGLAEVMKYGVIADYEFLTYLQEHLGAILALEDQVLERIVTRCCGIKAEIVAADEREAGLRRVLNYGHTVAHALEAVTKYGTYTHGEAVLIGMYLEAQMARKLGLLGHDDCSEILDLIQRLGSEVELEFKLEHSLLSNMVFMMGKDKKNRDGKIAFVLPIGAGQTREVLLTNKEAQSLLECL